MESRSTVYSGPGPSSQNHSLGELRVFARNASVLTFHITGTDPDSLLSLYCADLFRFDIYVQPTGPEISHALKDDRSSQRCVFCQHASLPLRASLVIESSIAEHFTQLSNLLLPVTASIDRHAIPHHDGHSPGRHPQFMFMCVRKPYVIESASYYTSVHFHPNNYAAQFSLATISRKAFPWLLDAKA